MLMVFSVSVEEDDVCWGSADSSADVKASVLCDGWVFWAG